eukprot:5792115-Pyramimonas_sp.AAC.1
MVLAQTGAVRGAVVDGCPLVETLLIRVSCASVRGADDAAACSSPRPRTVIPPLAVIAADPWTCAVVLALASAAQ